MLQNDMRKVISNIEELEEKLEGFNLEQKE
jgi:hypothetical protein